MRSQLTISSMRACFDNSKRSAQETLKDARVKNGQNRIYKATIMKIDCNISSDQYF